MENILCLLTIKVCFSSLLPPPVITHCEPLEHIEHLLLHWSSTLPRGWPLRAWLAQGGLGKARNFPHKPYNPQVAQTKYFLSHKNFTARNAWFTARFMFISVRSHFSSPECNKVQWNGEGGSLFLGATTVECWFSPCGLTEAFLMLMVRTRQSYFNPKSLILILHCFVSVWGTPLIEVLECGSTKSWSA